MQFTTIQKLKSCSDLPHFFDLKAGIGQVLLYNNNMAPAVRTFSSVYFKLHGNSFELSEGMQQKLKGKRKASAAAIPNASGQLFHEIKYFSALTLQSKGEAFGNDMVQLASKRVSPMDFPQRLMPESSFEDHFRARRLFYSQPLQAKKKGTSKRVAVALDYVRFQPLYTKVRDEDFDDETDVFFYLPLGKHTSPKFYVILVDEKGKEHRLEGSLGTESEEAFTFTSNWNLALLVSEAGYPMLEFYLTNVVLDEDKAQHFFACNASIEWPRLFMIECVDCSASLSNSQYCTGRGFCAEVHELMDKGMEDDEIKKQLAAKRMKNQQYNRSLEKHRFGHISVSSMLLAEQACHWPISDVEIAMVRHNSFVCRMGPELFVLNTVCTVSVDKKLENKLEEVFEYSLPNLHDYVCASPFVEKKFFYYLTKDAELHCFDFEKDLGKAETHKALEKDFCPIDHLSHLRIVSAERDSIACYFEKNGRHGLFRFPVPPTLL